MSDRLREQCMRWAAPFLRVLVDGSTVLSDRDDAERLWPETRTALLEIATEIERQGKALRAVKQLCVARCNANEYDIEPYDPTTAFIATVYAALAQTEPQI